MLTKKSKTHISVPSFRNFLLILIFAEGIGINTGKAQNLLYADDKLFHFGFSLGYNAMDFGITQRDTVIGGQRYNIAVSDLQPGFSVGIIGNLRLNRYLNLRCTPTLHLGSRVLTYRSANGLNTESTTISSIPIALPVYLKYSAERKNNYRPYIIWGGGTSIDLATDRTKPVLLKPLNFYTEFGVGCDIYFSFFKLAPEIKFGLGFNNILTPLDSRINDEISDDSKKYTALISKLTSKMLTLTFNFE